ncbi:hypothetical protein LPJ78_002367 [Coemansia sp. RSA 989]|nr:ankyrin repeat-containing domain protein [Coemansia mojavensis]KAJ1742725.1 hypothetical protein LPJ68_001604 [Coemansia sp. RSA 1086]KAJ1751336.1 hypothetical protein LPJ79_002117 [Coemansia sp. RSA 1821]KAJ1865872.1 hypothetical protein LPJ78_002367 [Coemansia sp. RSA 989]KAJ1873123.1 hypothetical protein LPJ55_002589 [Coemansia sp. RSA 990]KAJ2633335.1 hypothetical protein H4R22_000523 [Coemansia sp. RSA 1290]KAJ2647814.1 hypothetical protein IWW40_004436 [Coemansia sp. RSA 1250]
MSDEGASKEEQLLAACMSNQYDLVQSILDSPGSVKINHANGLGHTALHYAAKTGSVECVKLLVRQKGIDANIQESLGGNTPLHLALIYGEYEEDTLQIVKLLVKAKANLRLANKDKKLPKDLAEKDEEDIQRVLVQAELAAASNMEAANRSSSDSDDDDSDDASD